MEVGEEEVKMTKRSKEMREQEEIRRRCVDVDDCSQPPGCVNACVCVCVCVGLWLSTCRQMLLHEAASELLHRQKNSELISKHKRPADDEGTVCAFCQLLR